MRLHRSSNFQAQRTPLAWLFGLADFILPLKNSIVPTKGAAPTACTRASAAWITDNEGKVVEVPTNCARFEGARSAPICAWYDPAGIINFPKGCNNNALGDANDASVRYVSDGYSTCGKTGSGIPFAKTTHNGQNCGIADVNGLMWEVSLGITSDGTNFYIAKTDIDWVTRTEGTTLATDMWGTAGIAANYDSLGATYGPLQASSTLKRLGLTTQTFSSDTSGVAYRVACLGVPLSADTVGTNQFGLDGLWDYRPNQMYPLRRGTWSHGSDAGVGALYLAHTRGNASYGVGFRAAAFLPSFTSVTGDENVRRSGGVGVCPELPSGYTALSGHNVPESDNFGNYQYSDGSVMVWFSVHYYKYNSDNTVDIRPYSYFANLTAAQAAGYTIHQMFYNGGVLQPGYFLDKYKCSNNSGTASSIRFGNPLSFHPDHNPVSGLTGAPPNIYASAIPAAKTRGAQFFPANGFMHAGTALLSLWQGQHAASFANTTGLPGWAFSTLANDGTSIPDDSLLGYKSEGARVNPVWPCSDMTHANWVKGAMGSELVTNGTFDTDTSGWTAESIDGPPASVTWSAGKMRVESITPTSYGLAVATITTIVNKTYTLSFDLSSPTSGCMVRVGSTLKGFEYLNGSSGSHQAGTHSFSFKALGTTTHLTLGVYTTGHSALFDNVSVKESAVTPVLNATDIRGFPNTATTLTATANGATITYPVALSGTRAMSIYLKRAVGTGTIEFTHDGTTWTDVTSSLSTGAFFRVRLENKTVSNPHSIGLRFGTSGDAVIACAAQDEDGPTVSTPIFAETAPMTRAADSGIVFDRGSVLVDNAGTAYARWSTDTLNSLMLVYGRIIHTDGTGLVMYLNATVGTNISRAYDGSSPIAETLAGLSRTNTTLRKQVTCWSETTGGPNKGLRVITEGNTTPSTGTAYDTTMGAAPTFSVGGTGFLNARDVTLWGNLAVTDAQMVGLNT